uniref:G2/mitotic-specific cyclin-B3 n=1 Tax=Strongyloides venezuelensis TaxID=75913 RepID=A0A0K0F9W8_STRVS
MMLRSRSNAVNGQQDGTTNSQETKGLGDKKRHATKEDLGLEPKPKRSALNDLSKAISNVVLDSNKKDSLQKPDLKRAIRATNLQTITEAFKSNRNNSVKAVKEPPTTYDFDRECSKDLTANATFANDIFNYLKSREPMFKIGDYMKKHKCISHEMRGILGDWMIEVQESFELYHETLYLAVKLTDLYLDRVESVRQEDLQLIGSAAIFIASKFDERSPPLIEDFLYVCNDSFSRDDLIEMEMKFLRVVGFEALTAPLSYRFLRRYSRVIKGDMATLTAARYVLETSLLWFDFSRVSESKMAAASLLWALRVKKVGDWNPILVKYSGYRLDEIEPLMYALNHMVHVRPKHLRKFTTVYEKYSHEVFYKSSLLTPLPDIYKSTDPIKVPPGC